MRAVLCKKPGGPEVLYVGDVPKPHLKSKQVLIKVHATAVNRADTLQRQGAYPAPPGESEILGLEVSGVIEECDLEVTKWHKGDKVMALLGGGGYAEYVAAHESLVMPVPKGLSLTEAAAIPETWLTAYQLLHLVGNVKPGDKVLIHAAGSGVGLAAIQLAKEEKASVYATAGAESKLGIAKQYGADATFNYRDGSFSDKVKKATEGGANLILDCVGGSFWQQNCDAIADDGRWVIYGTLGLGRVEGDIISAILRKRINVRGTTLRARSLEYKSTLVQDFTKKVVPLFESGKVKPVIDSKYPLESVGEAHKYMEENKNIGKILLLVEPSDK